MRRQALHEPVRKTPRCRADAEQFKIRSHAEYRDYFIGFAEMAKRDDVDQGRMNRNCPAKELSVVIGKTFFTLFEKSEWKLSPAARLQVLVQMVGRGMPLELHLMQGRKGALQRRLLNTYIFIETYFDYTHISWLVFTNNIIYLFIF